MLVTSRQAGVSSKQPSGFIFLHLDLFSKFSRSMIAQFNMKESEEHARTELNVGKSVKAAFTKPKQDQMAVSRY